MTDVTGFALTGHLLELCTAAGLDAVLDPRRIPKLQGVDDYIEMGCIPGGNGRNFNAFGGALAPMSPQEQALLCDPQTSGGLLIAARADAAHQVASMLRTAGFSGDSIGKLTRSVGEKVRITLGAL